MPFLPLPVIEWIEPPGASLDLGRSYWAYDPATLTWSVTTIPAQSAGTFAAAAGTTQFALLLTASIPGGATQLVTARRVDGALFLHGA